MLKKGLVLGLFILCYGYITAQELRIAKDNILCLMGLKNAQGVWITEPRFTTLELLGSGTYRSWDGLKYGLLNAEGKEIIEPIYDNISWINGGLYEVKNGRKIGYLDRNMQDLIPIEYVYSNATFEYNKLLLHKLIGDTIYSTIISTVGKEIMPLRKGAYLPARSISMVDEMGEKRSVFFVSDSCRFVVFSGQTVSFGKLGLSDINGKVLIPQAYDKLSFKDEKSCWVLKDNKLGLVDFKGKTLIEPHYYYDFSSGYLNSDRELRIPSGQPNYLIPIYSDTYKKGRMNLKGEIVIATEYDDIETVNHRFQQPTAFFILHKGKKVGLAGENGQITCPVEYDTLIPIPYVAQGKTNYSEKAEQVWYVFRKDGCYGVMNTRGETVVQPDYRTFTRHWSNNRQVVLFTKELQVVQLEFGVTEVKVIQMREVNREQGIYLYTADSIPIPFVLPKAEIDLKLHERFNYEEKYLKVTLDGAHYGAQLTFNLQGKLVLPRQIASSKSLTKELMEVRTYNFRSGVLNIATGKWVLDTLYGEIKTAGRDYFWARFYESTKQEWIVFNSSGKRLSSDRFSSIFTPGDTTLAIVDNQVGLLATDFHWIIQPKYKSLIPFGKQAYIAVTPSSKVGFVKIGASSVTDTLYSYVAPVYSHGFNAWRDYSSSKIAPCEWWLFANTTDTLLINDQGERISQKKQPSRFNELMDDFALSTSSNEAQGAFVLRMRGESYVNKSPLDSVFRNLGYKHELLTYYRSQYNERRPCTVVNRSMNQYNCSDHNLMITLMGVGKQYYSVETAWYEQRYSMEMPMEPERFAVYDNVIYKNNQRQNVTLLSIFGKEEVLRDELIRAIRADENRGVSCSDPDHLTEKIKGFYLTSEGVKIIYEHESLEPLTIPLSRLKNLPESKWLVPYLQ